MRLYNIYNKTFKTYQALIVEYGFEDKLNPGEVIATLNDFYTFYERLRDEILFSISSRGSYQALLRERDRSFQMFEEGICAEQIPEWRDVLSSFNKTLNCVVSAAENQMIYIENLRKIASELDSDTHLSQEDKILRLIEILLDKYYNTLHFGLDVAPEKISKSILASHLDRFIWINYFVEIPRTISKDRLLSLDLLASTNLIDTFYFFLLTGKKLVPLDILEKTGSEDKHDEANHDEVSQVSTQEQISLSGTFEKSKCHVIPRWLEVLSAYNNALNAAMSEGSNRVSLIEHLKKNAIDLDKNPHIREEEKILALTHTLITSYREILRGGLIGFFEMHTNSILVNHLKTFARKMFHIDLPSQICKGETLSLDSLLHAGDVDINYFKLITGEKLGELDDRLQL